MDREPRLRPQRTRQTRTCFAATLVPHPVCPECGMPTDREWIDPSFRLGRTDLDASYTYCGYLIVSEHRRSVASLSDGHDGRPLVFIQRGGQQPAPRTGPTAPDSKLLSRTPGVA